MVECLCLEPKVVSLTPHWVKTFFWQKHSSTELRRSEYFLSTLLSRSRPNNYVPSKSFWKLGCPLNNDLLCCTLYPSTLITETDYWLTNFHFCYRELLKEIKKAGEIHIVLDCSTEKIQSILTHASQVGMMTAYHNYLITSLVRTILFWHCVRKLVW